MCSKLITALAACCIWGVSSAQIFQQVYQTEQIDFLNSVEQLDDNGFILTGYTNGAGSGGNDAIMIRTTPFGDILWAKAYGSAGNESFPITAPFGDNAVLVAGSTQSVSESGLPEGFVAAIDIDGEVLWTTCMGGELDDKVRDIKVLDDGGFLLTGMTNSFGEVQSYDLFLNRFDSEGTMLWSKVYGTDMYDVPLAVEANDEGEIFVWGHQSGDQTVGYDAFLLKTDSEGNELWNNRYSLELNELAWDLAMLPDGNIIITGDTNSAGAGMNDIFVIYMDQDGELIWSKTVGNYSHDHGTNVRHVQNKEFVIGGATGSIGAGGLDFVNVYMDTNGIIKYTVAFGGGVKDVAHGMTVTSDFGVATVGETRSFGTGVYSGLFVKTDQEGRCACNNAYSIDFEANDIEFNIGSAGLELRGEGMVSEAVAFLNSTDDVMSTEVLCSDAPSENVLFEEQSGSIDVAHSLYSRLNLFPNPSNSGAPVKATIKTQKEEKAELILYDLEGSVVYQRDFRGTNGMVSISIPDLSTGIYLARLHSGERIETKKLIVE